MRVGTLGEGESKALGKEQASLSRIRQADQGVHSGPLKIYELPKIIRTVCVFGFSFSRKMVLSFHEILKGVHTQHIRIYWATGRLSLLQWTLEDLLYKVQKQEPLESWRQEWQWVAVLPPRITVCWRLERLWGVPIQSLCFTSGGWSDSVLFALVSQCLTAGARAATSRFTIAVISIVPHS